MSFQQYEFLSETSNGLDGKMITNIGCKEMSFHQYEFLNVSSKFLLVKMPKDIGFKEMAFHQYTYLKYLQITSFRKCFNTLVASKIFFTKAVVNILP